jgi:RNA recognition motif-containing protein
LKLYVGNLSYSTNDDSLRAAFAQYGSVVSATVVQDKFSGRSRGFGFVEMGSGSEAEAAIQGLDGKMLDGREIRVSEAKPQREFSDAPRRGGGGGGDRRSRF